MGAQAPLIIRPTKLWRSMQSGLYLLAMAASLGLMNQGSPRFLLWWVMGLVVVFSGWCLLRVWRVKLILGTGGMTIEDMFKSIYVPRADVARISSVATLFGHRHEYFVEYRDGTLRRVSWMFSFFSPSFEKQMSLNEINSWAGRASAFDIAVE